MTKKTGEAPVPHSPSIRALHQFARIASDSFRALLAARGWLLVPLCAIVFVVTSPQLLQVELGAPGAATTARIAAILGEFELALVLTLLTAIYAGELVWRERDARMHALAGVTPMSDAVALLGKFASLAMMLAAAQAVFVLAGVVVQLLHGTPIDVPLYLELMFGFQFVRRLLFVALAFAIHVLANQKYVGNVLVLLAFATIEMAGELGLEHRLLLFGSAPRVTFSEMNGFAGAVGPWCWFTLYWTGWALLLGAVTYLFWMRGEEHGLRRRLASARARLTRLPAAVAIVAIAIVAGAGTFVYWNTNVQHRYVTASEAEQRRAAYERHYAMYANAPQPTLAATQLRIDFYPERRSATVRGTYRLDNRTAAAIDTILVATNRDVTTTSVAFDRAAHAARIDDAFGQRLYTLARALQPGESLQMTFGLAFDARGFANDGVDTTVTRNGSWLEQRGVQGDFARQWLPAIGYQPARELEGAALRAQYGLPSRPDVRSLDDVAARNDSRGRERIAFDAVIGTSADQIGVAPGELRRTWTERGRRYFHYVADAPISNLYAIFSAHYAVERAQWRDVSIEVFHHPSHAANVGALVRSVRASLDTYTRAYGPYPHHELRLVEYPGSAGDLGLTAYPGLIKYSEGLALVRPQDDPRGLDLPFAVVAHEVAHQWWAHQLVPAPVEGAPLLTETLAWYSAMNTVEATNGRAALDRLLAAMRVQYEAPHAASETPLLRTTAAIDAYRTGPFAMFTLREAIGRPRVDAALHHLLARFANGQPPYATSRDLYAELQKVTPADKQSLLHGLFE